VLVTRTFGTMLTTDDSFEASSQSSGIYERKGICIETGNTTKELKISIIRDALSVDPTYITSK